MTDKGSGITVTDGITFTVHYSDGTSKEVKDGVLFAINGSSGMNVHVGVDEKWQLFGVHQSFFELLVKTGMTDDFDAYMTRMAKAMRGEEVEAAENADAAELKTKVVRGIWDE